VSITKEPAATGVGYPLGAENVTAPSSHLLWRLLKDPIGLLSLLYLTLLVLAVAAAPWLAPANPLSQDLTHVLSGPTTLHPLGTDQLGRDVLSRLLYGGRVTLIGVAETVLVALVLGLVLGLIAGYARGAVDTNLSRAAEVVMAVPAIVILLMVFSVFDNNENWAMLALGLLYMPIIFRVTRAAAWSVRDEGYVTSARISGVSTIRIITRHIMPHTYRPLIVNTSILAAVALGVQGGLNFIGLGVTPPAPSWGGMVAEAQESLQQQPWLVVTSGLTIGLTILAFLLLGDALRDAVGHGNRPPSNSGAVAQHVSEQCYDDVEVLRLTEPLLSVTGLSVSFVSGNSDVRVVQNIGFDVLPGEALGIVGESGCGKSITCAAILGLLDRGGRVTNGRVLFNGLDLLQMTRSERIQLRGRDIAFVSQSPMTCLDPNFTVGHQVAEVVGVHFNLSRSDRRARALELLGQVGLPDPFDTSKRYLHQLSGGMAQRVAIAVALAGRPRLLIADEPTTAMDVAVQAEILELLRNLQRDTGLSILFVTHDLGVVADLCARAVVLYAGEVVEFGPIRDLLAEPSHPYTRALVGSDPSFGVPGQPLAGIPGTVPEPRAWPAGCHFADRCEFQSDECLGAPIALSNRAHDRVVRCLRSEHVLRTDAP
jgi:peptide/nickel transport system permease protein